MSYQAPHTTRTNYYYVQGQQVALKTDSSVFAVRFRTGRRADDPS